MEHSEVSSLVSVSEAFVCVSQDDAVRGQEILDSIKQMVKRVKEHHRPAIEAAHNAHKQAIAAEKKILAPLEAALSAVKGTIDRYIAAEREKARQKALEEQRKAEEEARAAAEAARAEAARIEEERRQAMLAASPDEPLPILDFAPVNVFEPAVIPPPPPPPPAKLPDLKAAGIRTRHEWKWELVSLRDLCRAVADGEAPEDLIQVNSVFVNRMVSTLKADAVIPGVRVFDQEVSL